MKLSNIFALFYIISLSGAVVAQPAATVGQPPVSYARLADIALPAPVVAKASIRDAIRLPDERAIGVPAGSVRYYVEADVQSLIRSDGPLPARITYLVDVPLLANGRRPDIEDKVVLLFARRVDGHPASVQLVGGQGQMEWTQRREDIVRSILTDATRADAPPMVTGVGNIFSVPGTLPGESETQIFLATEDGRPVSLSVLRRPNQRPRWSVSLSEVVESALPPPERDTLLWYRLACSLPAQLPMSALESMAPNQVEIARADYRLVTDDLGPCDRPVD